MDNCGLTFRTRWVAVIPLLLTTIAAAYTPTTYTGTGAYRRVYAQSSYSFMTASIYLPSAPSISMKSSDTPYVYTGGWGTNGATAVDAGFQYSPTFNNWSLFLKAQGFNSVSDTAPRFKSGQNITLQFDAVPISSTLATLEIIADGIDINNNVAHRMLSVANVPNWGAGLNTLKRMTSLAQANGDQFSDGSFINGVHWFNTTIGTSAADAQPWLAAQTGGYESYSPGVVSVQYVNAGEETDSINLVTTPEPGIAMGSTLICAIALRRRQRGLRKPLFRSQKPASRSDALQGPLGCV